jgi:hypothetical protein
MDSGSASASSADTFFTSAALVLRLAISFLSHQEQGVEHDRLSEGNSQNRLDQNLR